MAINHKNWVAPANVLSILGALAAWTAVAVQLTPEPKNPTLRAAEAVETFEMRFSRKCVDTETINCFYAFWSQYAKAWTAIKKVENLDSRNQLFSRINKIRNNDVHNYADPNDEPSL